MLHYKNSLKRGKPRHKLVVTGLSRFFRPCIAGLSAPDADAPKDENPDSDQLVVLRGVRTQDVVEDVDARDHGLVPSELSALFRAASRGGEQPVC